jgi:hypothetical protein
MEHSKQPISADPGLPVADRPNLPSSEVITVSKIRHDDKVVPCPMPFGKCDAHRDSLRA